jgi:hypothetical protein
MRYHRVQSALGLSVVLAALAALPISSARASPVIVDFDTFPGGAVVPSNTLITTHYSSVGVLFSSPAPAGGAVTLANGEASSGPNFLVGFDAGGNAGLHPITMDFTSALASAVNVTLISVGCGTVTATAYASDLATVLDTVSVTHGPLAGVGFGNHDPITLTMGAGTGIARINFSILQNGPVVDGFGIDDVVFTAIPAPGAAALLGLGGLVAIRRRR